ncbi:MAG: flavodoxin-dependent (E)-4-hydroxy-3-methylbut-2-enyl-diphosphate synthase [Treponema sp.]|nr:flavodoxin-dependent (E)-4-hydroxy-3-methylbut-2-enyl-diphosphate synthase [Treponema sp.]
MTRTVSIGGSGLTKKLNIGGGSPISVQTMWKEGIAGIENDSQKFERTLRALSELEGLGCDIVRFAVPDEASAKSLCAIAERTQMPLVADIHFDYRLALECLKGNVAVIRINPGNIGSRERVEAVVNACREKNVAIRIGVNSGSLQKDLSESVAEGKISRGEALAISAEREAQIFDELGFSQVVVSMKASSVAETIDANEAFSKKFDIPLHIGVTEAGPLIGGIVKSTLAFSALLSKGIGDTIRVSLSSLPQNEVIAGCEILRECGKRSGGVRIVSCPRCGREGFDVHSFVQKWEARLLSSPKNVTIAVMGCAVNGPGEAKHADLGIAGAGGKAIIFKKGKIIRTIPEENADNVFEEEFNSL